MPLNGMSMLFFILIGIVTLSLRSNVNGSGVIISAVLLGKLTVLPPLGTFIKETLGDVATLMVVEFFQEVLK